MNKYKEIGDRIKHLRGPDTQPEFAKKVGVSLRALQNYEDGTRMPKRDILDKIAAMRRQTADFILYGGPRELSLEEAREQVKYHLWLEGETPKEEDLDRLSHQYLEGTKPASIVAETHIPYLDDLDKKIMDMLQGLNKDQKRQALRFLEGQKLLAEREKKLKKEAG